MARSGYSNPMQEHHKKARQKELQRNKQKRTKERDEKALQTKTIKEVREEIQKLERDLKRNHGQQQKSTAQHKLARLQKELKLLQEQAAKAKAQADADAEAYRIANKYRQPQRPLTELDDPRKSVYYDAVMNPYGAPPPGKPRLYHRRYGGVTPNIHEACVPGEEMPPPPPPPHDNRQAHSPRHGHSRGDQRHQNNRNSHHEKNSHKSHPNQQSQQEGSSDHSQKVPKRQPLHIPPPSKSESNGENSKKKTEQSKTEEIVPEEKPTSKSKDKPTDEAQESSKKSSKPAIPSLPAPSAAVQRTIRVAKNKSKTRRGAALADIWASTEEVEYERVTNLVDLEADDLGTAKAKKPKKSKKKKKKPPLEFYYRDTSGNVQGPFTKAQMRGWIDAGYFPPTTKARTNRMDPDGWVPMGDLPALKETPQSNNNSVQDRIAALKGGDANNDDNDMDAAMQARIAAMKADLMGSSAPAVNDAEDEDSVQGRIAALKGNTNSNDNRNDDDIDPVMQARIAAMKADLMGSSAPAVNEDEDSVQARIAALKGGDNDESNNQDIDASMQARIAAMRADISGPNASESTLQDRLAALRKNAPLPAGQIVENEVANMSVQERIAALRKNAPPPPPPPPPPTYQADNDYAVDTGPSAYPVEEDGVAAYPIDDEEGVASYPIDEEEGVAAYPAAYPLDEQDGVAAYPVDDAVAPYPGADDLAYPVTSSYGEEVPPYGAYPSEESQKVVKVDKALVSFVPSNLQSKKRKVEEASESVKKAKQSTKAVTTSDEKYDKFLQEIDEL